MKLLLLDKDNKVLLSDHWDGTIIVNASVDFIGNEWWTIIKLLKDYDTTWDLWVCIGKDWEINYIEKES